MKHIFIILSILFVLIGTKSANAQIDTVFWFSAPWLTPDHTNQKPMAFHISTFNNPTTVRIKQPAGTYDTTIVIPPNTLFSKYVSFMINQVETKPANTVLSTGFRFTSDYPITVVYDIITAPTTYYNPETYSLKGQNGLGKEFVLPFQTLWHNRPSTADNNGDGVITQPYQQFSVVASEDNTTVYITPKTDIVGHPANVTFSVFLPFKGNTWTGQNIYQEVQNPGQNLAGTIVVSDKPISITVCEDSVQPAGGCADELGDQIVPVDVVGNEYIVNRGFLNAAVLESFFVVATENFTSVTINDGIVTNVLLNKGDTYPYNIQQPLTHIQTDKSVYLYHMSGYGCELGSALLPPLNCAGSDQVSFARANGQSFLLNILCKGGTEGAFQLNGNPALIPASAFAPVPGTGGAWMGAQISFTTAQVPVGTANTVTNSMDNFALGVINGGPSTGCLYHYLSSFLRRVYTDAGEDTTLCSGINSIDLIGSVKGGVTTGEWSVLDGSGTIADISNLSTTYSPTVSDFAQGELTFVLTSTGNCTPVTDTMKVFFIQPPEVSTGADMTYCRNNIGAIPVSGTLNFAIGSTWYGGNGGSFANSGNLSTTYTPSPTDIAQDSIVLYLESQGSLYNCPNDIDSVVIHFTDEPSVFAGTDIYVCSSVSQVSLNGLVSGGATTGVWSTGGSGSFSPSEFNLSTDYIITAADTTSGQVKIYLTSTNNGNCIAAMDSIVINIYSKPVVEITSQDSICSNLPILNLDGIVSLGFNAVWSVDGLGTIADPNSLNTFYTLNPLDANNGYITVYLTTDATVCPSEVDSIQVYFIAPPVVDAGSDLAICQNEPVALNGSISGPNSGGVWNTLGTGSFVPGNNFLNTYYYPSALDVANGSVTLVLSSLGDFGCAPDNDNMVITFKPIPAADFSNNTACEGNNTSFQDASTTSTGSITGWAWDFGDGGNSIINNPQHVYPGYGDYTVTLVATGSNGCTDTVQRQIYVNPAPDVAFSYSTPCVNMPIKFTDKSTIPVGSVVAWNYSFGNGDNSSQQNPTYTYYSSADYGVTLTVTSDVGCTASTTYSIFVNPAPDAEFTMDPNPAMAMESVDFIDQSVGTGISGWLWNFGDEQGDNTQHPTHVYTDGGTYNVFLVVTDANGCVDTAFHEMVIGLMPNLPSGFSPNGDGENDVFIIRGGPFNNVIFQVFNNWGELLFETHDSKEGWDGTYKGQPVPVGVYTWVMKVELFGGKMVNKSGDVTLLR
ncbi:MAG: PKD domain-containing protein [Brumimicrobium sp.]|nr:PKD domain-containing protein [Brumimicrobium sp.]MCO5269659.1 PKD domain-containing protein [Brumimicrobium sp.]